MREAVSYIVGKAVAQLGMSLSGGSRLIEDEPLELRNRGLYYDSRVGGSFLRTKTN